MLPVLALWLHSPWQVLPARDNFVQKALLQSYAPLDEVQCLRFCLRGRGVIDRSDQHHQQQSILNSSKQQAQSRSLYVISYIPSSG